ncbi:MAG: DUF4349 domain-containing protein [Patescibacteria group bacterium]|nr:DUF4349 domain-containing protein [Patescibacteria group bacterium]
MSKIFSWLKKNKLTAFLLLIILFLLLKNRSSVIPLYQREKISYPASSKSLGVGGGGREVFPEFQPQTSAPVSEINIKDRLVIKDSYLSLLVNDVIEAQKAVIKKAESLGGYMVSSSLERPDELPSATVIVRVPSNKLEKALTYFRSLGIKVVFENLSGQDVTDQYIDVEKRLETLNKTKIKFEKILEETTRVPEILEVQRELINLQSQIDSLKGQEQYLKENAKLTKITVYLASDELSLPYAPSESWRPKVIFKQAVRSLVNNLRKLGTLLIWLAVYSVVLVPVGLVSFWGYKFFKKRK